MAMTLNSTAFKQNGHIPSKYTCEGDNVSPPLEWDGVPEGAKSLVLIIDDPDAPDPKAPQRVWVHWVAYNIPPRDEELAGGRRQGRAAARYGAWGE
jgi:Raf kinase inhibitor-like YbhB/YbcL family protein